MHGTSHSEEVSEPALLRKISIDGTISHLKIITDVKGPCRKISFRDQASGSQKLIMEKVTGEGTLVRKPDGLFEACLQSQNVIFSAKFSNSEKGFTFHYLFEQETESEEASVIANMDREAKASDPPRLATSSSPLSIYLGWAYHTHQNQIQNQSASDQIWKGSQLSFHAESGFKLHRAASDPIKFGLNVDGANSQLSTQIESSIAYEKLFSQMGDWQIKIGGGASTLSMIGPNEYGTSLGLSPTVSARLLNNHRLDFNIFYAPFLSAGSFLSNARYGAFASVPVRLKRQLLRLAIKLDSVSINLESGSSLVSFRSTGITGFVGIPLGENK